WLEVPESREAVETAERYADGEATEQERHQASVQAHTVECREPLVWLNDARRVGLAALACSLDVRDAATIQRPTAALLSDILGNPFRPAALAPPWGPPPVAPLPQTAYEERTLPAGPLDPDRLAVLADALEEAGCDNPDILSHLRGPGPHVRGCWA